MPAEGRRVASPPPKPLVVFDGRCGFCRRWIDRARESTADTLDFVESQDPRVAAEFPEIPTADFASAVQLIEPDGRVSSGAAAVFRGLAAGGASTWPLRVYEHVPLAAPAAGVAYRLIARHRPFFDRVTTELWGHHLERPSYDLVRWLFLRALGLVYLVAFLSLLVQVHGLIGSRGILPAGNLMDAARAYFDGVNVGLERYRVLPTLGWISASDASLVAQCVGGAVAAAFVMAGVVEGPCLALCWLLYLSLATLGQDFLGFQWDNLLLEAGLIAIGASAWSSLRSRIVRTRAPSRAVVWLYRWLAFRLMFESGCVKLLSGDATWRHLTALTFHYETQPLPTWIGWYAHQLPVWFQKGSCAGVFVIELAVPFLVFAPRRLRVIGGLVMAVFQVLILLTGNYTFFNYLTIAIFLWLADDAALRRVVPRGMIDRLSAPSVRRLRRSVVRRAAAAVVAAGLTAASSVSLLGIFGVRPAWLSPAVALARQLAPLRSVNGYGLFAVMTTTRPEIRVEGSDDGVTWRAYGFKDKAGDVTARPRFIAPYQPRLDWQMWFAALGTARTTPWFLNFCERLLQGSPDVLALLASNPFPDHPPRYIRAEMDDYRFTDLATHHATGAWWTTTPAGEYVGAMTLGR
ncbi:MAG TPA: lipase maturation factor family protein [Vicinamibacterales bacterium]|nr:lipase maturation factor family protein [Vicinamibacterales bacterium]